ncbi:MAG: sulfatase [Thermomicrobiales bacterium]
MSDGGQRLNIVYLHSHDTGRYVQPYGAGVQTPNIQRLAEEGVLFRRAFSAAPTCSPSRAALLTGQSPHAAGMLGLAHRGFGLRDPNQHLANVLRSHGYMTALFGMQHVTHDDPHQLGYEAVAATNNCDVANVAPQAAAYIAALADRANDRPFFLDVGFSETHRPFHQAQHDEGRYLRPPAPIPDMPETRQDMADYHASVRELDHGVGIVLDALEQAGLAESTLVINTTDHGLAFPNMKSTLTDHGIGVSLIMRGPNGFSRGSVIDALVSQIDLFPTLCELIGIPRPEWLQGASMLPLVRSEADAIREEIFAEVTYHAAYEPQRAIRTDRWTYIRRFDDRTQPVLPNCDDSPTRDYLLEHGWGEREIEPEVLYDNLLDPNQACNVIGMADLASVVSDLRDRLDQWMNDTDDPLLEGPLPLPPGGVANDPDGRSATERPTIQGPAL